MAPTNGRANTRGGLAGRVTRNANTNAGVSCARAPYRSTARLPPRVPPGTSLASRITYADGRGGGTGRRGTARPVPVPQRGRLVDRITRGNGAADVGQAQGHARGRARTQTTGRAVNTITSTTNNANNNNSAPQFSPLFYTSQSTQQSPPTPRIPTPRGPAGMFNTQTTTDIPATAPPIRMVNVPVTPPPADPKRPANTYRGNDPIKKIVSNKKLQAIFAGKPLPRDRRVAFGERMELRLGSQKVMK